MYKKLGIAKKFTIEFFVWLIVPLILLFIWINNDIKKEISKENCKTNLAVLKQTKIPLMNAIKDIVSVSLEGVENNKLQKYLEEDSLDESQLKNLQQNVNDDFGNVLYLQKYITNLTIFNEQNILFQTGKYLSCQPVKYINEIKKLKGKMLWKPAAINEDYILENDKSEYEITCYRALNSLHKYHKILAYEKIGIQENYVSDLFSGIAKEGTKDMFIIDRYGNVVSSMNKEKLGKNVRYELRFPTMLGASEGYYIENDRDIIVSYYYLKNPDWYVVKIDEISSVIKNELAVMVIFICMLMVLIFAVFFYYMQKKRVITPIVQLSNDINKFKKGEYEVYSYSRSNDEIGMLNDNFIEMSQYIQNLIESVYKSQLKEKEAQLKCLQSQINPHFLYNTLDSMRWMAVKQQQFDLAEQIEALSALFKHALNSGKELTTVAKEIEHLNNYIVIQKNRFGERIKVEISVDPKLSQCVVLNLILQPLVENSIIHGIGNKINGGKVKIVVEKTNENLCYIVEDDGIGTDQEVIRKKLEEYTEAQDTFALSNINQRIKYKYGKNYGIKFYSEINIGTRVKVILPLQYEEKHENIDCR